MGHPLTATDERTRLGAALEARVHEISRVVLETWHQRSPEAAGRADLRVQQDILNATDFSTRLITDYLLHGSVQSEGQARWLAANGKAPLRDTIALADLTKLYLYWRDTMIAAITTESTRLSLGDEFRDEALAIVRGGSDGSIVRMAKQFDVERRRLERDLAIERRRLAHQATHDALTGLPNRRLFFDRLSHALDLMQRQRSGIAVIFIDIDNFKLVNDRYGHSVGDEVLTAIAGLLTDALRRSDTIARIGGDEFVVLSEQLSEPEVDVRTLAERMREHLGTPCTAYGLQLSASMGVALAAPGMSADELIRLADDAMYKAKRGGAGRLHIAD